MNLHRLLLLTLLLTFALVTLGGVVHNTESSLACPDWPLCFGEILPEMKGGVAIEHSHRLLATLVGLLSIAITVLAARRRREDPIAFRWSMVALALVVGQGLLGGITVLLKLPTLVSTAHLATSMVFFVTLILLTYRTQPGFQSTAPSQAAHLAALRAVTIALVAVYLQMVVGALVRHTGSGAAVGLGPEAVLSGFDLGRGEKALWPSDGPGRLHMSHRFVALLVLGIVGWAGHRAFHLGRRAAIPGVPLTTLTVMGLLGIQIFLGAASVWSFLSIPLVTAHLAVGAGLLAALVWLRLLLRHPQGEWALAESGYSGETVASPLPVPEA